MKNKSSQEYEIGVKAYNQGRQFMDAKDYENAIPCFEKALLITVHFKTLELLGECFLKISEFEKAIIYLSSAVTLNKGVRAASLLAEAMITSENSIYERDALDVINISLERDSKNRKTLELKRIMEMRQQMRQPSRAPDIKRGQA